MKKLFTALAFLFLLANPAYAQYVRLSCATLTPAAGFRGTCFDYTTFALNYWSGSAWIPITGGGGGGTVTQVNTGTGLTGGPITTTGTVSGVDAAADGSTKGIAAFTANDFNASTGVISLDYTNGQKASGTQPGFLSSTDWNTFNNKQPAGSYLTAVTSNAPLSGSGTAGSHLVISQSGVATDGYLSSTDWNTFNNKQPAGSYLTSSTGVTSVAKNGSTALHGDVTLSEGANITLTQVGQDISIAATGGGGSGTVTNVATSNGITGGPITTTGTISGIDAAADGVTKGVAAFTASDFDAAAGVISIDYANGQAADATHKGFLTSADWSTFNAKQPAGSYLTAVTADTPLSGSGTAGSHLLISQSGAATDGYLSSTDWNTFNNKVGGPSGSDEQIQYNNAGSFGGSPYFRLKNTGTSVVYDDSDDPTLLTGALRMPGRSSPAFSGSFLYARSNTPSDATSTTESIAIEGENYDTHSIGTISYLTGVEGNAKANGGNVGNQDGVGGYNERNAVGTTDLMTALHAYAPTITAGTVTINAGLTIDDQSSSGATVDYSIYSPGTAPSLFGGNITNSVLTASEIVGTDASKNLVSVAVGTGLSLSAGTLSATGSGGGVTLDSEYNAGLGNVSLTLTVNKITPIDLGANNGGNLAANVTVTFPASPAVGDITGFFITRASTIAGSFAQAPGFGAEIANGTQIDGAAYTAISTGTGKWGLWTTGELLLFRYLDTNYGSGTAGWYSVTDGRIAMRARLTTVTATTTNTAATFTKIKYDTEDTAYKVGALADTTNFVYKIKRSGSYDVQFASIPNSAVVNQKYYGIRLWDGTNKLAALLLRQSATTSSAVMGTARAWEGSLAAAVSIEADFVSEDANMGHNVTDLTGDNVQDGVMQFAIKEQL